VINNGSVQRLIPGELIEVNWPAAWIVKAREVGDGNRSRFALAEGQLCRGSANPQIAESPTVRTAMVLCFKGTRVA